MPWASSLPRAADFHSLSGYNHQPPRTERDVPSGLLRRGNPKAAPKRWMVHHNDQWVPLLASSGILPWGRASDFSLALRLMLRQLNREISLLLWACEHVNANWELDHCYMPGPPRPSVEVLKSGSGPLRNLTGGFCAGSVREQGIKARKRGKLDALNLLDLATGAYIVC